MNATLMKRLFRVIQSGSSPDMETLCRRIVEGGGEYCFNAIERLIANAVPARLGYAIGQSILNHLN